MEPRIAIPDIQAHKNTTPLVVLTAYTAPVAKLLDTHVDILLVGDSLGMVVYGMENTQGVTLEMMMAHGRAVASASSRALVVVDMPFGSYEQSKELALANCERLLKETGAQAVKLEGGVELAETIRFLVERGVAVMGHVGLMPQRVSSPDGYRYQGRTDEEALAIEKDALAVEKAGAFAIVIEAVSETVARRLTGILRVPTIGIGASPACDGQVLVIDDMLGLSARVPSFVKKYGDVAAVIEAAVQAYGDEVRGRVFPGEKHVFVPKKKS